jgi:hypothetical protein
MGTHPLISPWNSPVNNNVFQGLQNDALKNAFEATKICKINRN